MQNLTVYLGRRGAGKSTLEAHDARRASYDNVMVVVHDELGGFPKEVGVRVSGMSALRSFAESGEIVVVRNVSLSELLEWMKKVSPSMPNGSLLMEDEGVLFTTADHQDKLKRSLREAAATARHVKMRMAIIAQGSMLIDQAMVSMADNVALFGVVGGYERTKMVQCGLPAEIVDKLPLLPDYQYYRGVPGRPAKEWLYHHTTIIV